MDFLINSLLPICFILIIDLIFLPEYSLFSCFDHSPVAATLALIFTACDGPPSLTILEGNTMGTTFQIKYVPPDGLAATTVLKVGVDSVLSGSQQTNVNLYT
jgi:hypothetical protein